MTSAVIYIRMLAANAVCIPTVLYHCVADFIAVAAKLLYINNPPAMTKTAMSARTAGDLKLIGLARVEVDIGAMVFEVDLALLEDFVLAEAFVGMDMILVIYNFIKLMLCNVPPP